MAELMFFTRKEISPYRYVKEGREGWTAEYHNVEVLADYYETTITADSDGKFPEDDLPSITFTFGIEGDDTPNYGKFAADCCKILKANSDSEIWYFTHIKVDFFKGIDIVYSFDTKTKGRMDNERIWGDVPYHQSKYFVDVRDFDKIVISFIEARPNSTGRINNILVDLLYPKVLDNKPLTINKFSNFKIKEAINVLSDDMPMGSLECDIVSDAEFNIKKTTLFDVENNGKYYGRFVVVDFKRTGDKSYHLSANSLKELLEREEYSDWLSNSDARNPLSVMSDKTNVGLGIVFQDQNDYKYCDGYIDVGTCRHALCQYAWAQNVMATDARKSYIEFIPVPKTVKHKITNSGGKKKIIGNSTLSETPQFLNARYTVYDYNFADAVVEIGKVTGILTTNQTYYFDKPPVIIDFEASGLNDYVGARPKYYVVDYSSSKIHFLQTAEFGDTPALEKTFMGYQSTAREFPYIINRDNAYVDGEVSGTKEYDKYTLCVKDMYNMPDNTVKIPMIKKVLESRGEVKAKIVLEDEQVGDLVDIDTAFEGTIRGIITSMEYTPNFQTIADITIQALDIGLEPLYDENGNPIYDKLDDIILVEGDA